MKLEFHLLDEDPAPQPQMRRPTQTYVVDNVLVDPDDLLDFNNVSLFFDILLEQEYGKQNYRLVRGEIESDDWEWALMWRIRVEFPHIYDKDRLVWITLLDEKDWPLDFQVAHEAAVDAWMWAEIKKWGEQAQVIVCNSWVRCFKSMPGKIFIPLARTGKPGDRKKPMPKLLPIRHPISIPQCSLVPDSANTDTYTAAMTKFPNPELEALRADPEIQQLASSTGVSVDDLLLFREMMIDRFAHRYQDPD